MANRKLTSFGKVMVTGLLVIITASLFFASCQADSNEMVGQGESLPEAPVSEDSSEAPLQVEVAIEGFAFNPPTLNIPMGSTVVWYNNDSVVHTATANDGSFNSGNLRNGDTFTYKFEEKGTFGYHCIPHPFMTGEIIVE